MASHLYHEYDEYDESGLWSSQTAGGLDNRRNATGKDRRIGEICG